MTDDWLARRAASDARPENVTQPEAEVALRRKAFETFYLQKAKTLAHVVKTFKAHTTTEEAWDATQTAMTELWIKWDEVIQPWPFVYTVARRTLCRQAPNRKFTSDAPVPDLADSALTPDVAVELTESTAYIEHLLDQLSPAQREPFVLAFNEFSVAEIAELTGKSECAVRKNISRAREALRKSGIVIRGGAQ